MSSLALAGVGHAAPAMAQVAIERINGNMTIVSEANFNGPHHAIKSAVLNFGTATAGEASGPGTVKAIANTQIVFPAEADFNAGSEWRVRATARHQEKLAVSSQYCSPACVESVALGIDLIVITFEVRASGAVTSFKSVEQFGASSAGVTFSYTLTSSLQSASDGGSKKSETLTCTAGINCPLLIEEGDISTSPRTLKLRPGETVELLMTATASAATVAVSDPPNSASYTTLADFSHTLEWRGVSEVRAFAANGDEIALTPGGRFKMIGEDTHHDYWFAAPGVGCDVPALDGSDPGAAGAGGADPCGTTASGGAGGADGNGEAAAAGGGGMPSTGGAPDGTDTGGETVGGGSNAAGTDSGTSGNDGDRGGYDDGGSSGSMSSSGGVGNRSSGGMVNNPGSDEDNCACRAPGKRSPLSSGVALAAAGLLWMCARRRQKSV